jgi:predicted DNA-binding transcriptional regulator YafY
MTEPQHDTIAYRLSKILLKLNQGDYLDPAELAEEFSTHVRTIQRDLKVRLAYLPMLKTRGRYHLEQAYLGKLNFKDIERFAALAGVKGLFPSWSREFLQGVLSEQTAQPWLVRGHHYEDLSAHSAVFDQLEEAIKQRCVVVLEMLKDGKVKSYQAVQPYRLINIKGIWYLAAVHEEKVKTFGVGKIKRVDVQAQTFSHDPSVMSSVESQEGIWHSSQLQKVLLSVAPQAAEYFERRQLVPHQKIVEKSLDGTLLVETMIGHQNQILPIVRYWIPNIRIKYPQSFQKILIDSLINYLKK